jgi:hypothetical protein
MNTERILAITRPAWTLAALSLFLCLTAVAAKAQEGIFSIENVSSAAPGGSGSFDVVLTASGGSIDIGGFTVEPSTMLGAGFSFTAAGFDTGAGAPYIFPDSFDIDNGLPLSYDPFPDTDFIALDADDALDGAVTIDDGQAVGLAHVTFTIDSGVTPGTDYIIDFADPGVGTSLSDGTGAAVNFTATPGTIVVGNGAAAPEPSPLASFGMVGLGLLCLVLRARCRRRSVSG